MGNVLDTQSPIKEMELRGREKYQREYNKSSNIYSNYEPRSRSEAKMEEVPNLQKFTFGNLALGEAVTQIGSNLVHLDPLGDFPEQVTEDIPPQTLIKQKSLDEKQKEVAAIMRDLNSKQDELFKIYASNLKITKNENEEIVKEIINVLENRPFGELDKNRFLRQGDMANSQEFPNIGGEMICSAYKQKMAAEDKEQPNFPFEEELMQHWELKATSQMYLYIIIIYIYIYIALRQMFA